MHEQGHTDLLVWVSSESPAGDSGLPNRRCRFEFHVQQLPDFTQNLHFCLRNSPVHHGASLVRNAAGASVCRIGPALAVTHGEGTTKMLWTLCLILLILWALGLAASYTAGGLIHILLVVAVVILVIRLIQGRGIA
jgi:predicted membrane protein